MEEDYRNSKQTEIIQDWIQIHNKVCSLQEFRLQDWCQDVNEFLNREDRMPHGAGNAPDECVAERAWKRIHAFDVHTVLLDDDVKVDLEQTKVQV